MSNDTILMSESLVERLNDEFGDSDTISSRFVIVTVDCYIRGERTPIVGSLKSVTLGNTVETNFLVQFSQAFNIIETNKDDIRIEKFELIIGDKIVVISGPFSLVSTKMSELDVVNMMCTLTLVVQQIEKDHI